MAETVGQHSVAAFTSPVNGTTPIDANTVRGNDNTVRSAYVDHDADPGIHVQSSTLASRPVAGTAGRKWITEDSGVYTLWFDDGTNWHPVSSEAVALSVLATETLAKGDVVKVTGWNNGQDLPEVAKTTSASDTAFAVITAAVASGAMGYATNTGVLQDINTNAYNVGDILYANGSGGFTATKPTSGNYQPCAYVLRKNTNNGVIYVEFSTPRIVERSDNTASTIVLRDASGNFAAGTITAGALTSTGLVTFASLKGTGATTVTNILDEDNMASDSATALATQQSIKAYVDAKVATVDTLAEVLANGNTTGANNIIVSTGQKIQTPTIAAFDNTTAISIANSTGALTLASALADSNLATISTAGKVANSATTATALNTSSAIVARDSSGNFAAGTITANLTGNISGTAPAGTLTGTTLASNVVSSSLTSVGTLSSLTVTNAITANGGVTIAGGSFASGRIYKDAGLGLVNAAIVGATNDWTLVNPSGATVLAKVATGSSTFDIVNNGTVGGALTVTGDLTVDTSTLKVDSANNRVGILTASPAYALDLASGIARFDSSGGDGLRVYGGSGTNQWDIYCNSTNLRFSDNTGGGSAVFDTGMTVDGTTLVVDAANNRVGIGTASPAAPLDVNGSIYSRTGGVYTDTITAYSGSAISLNAGSSNFNIVVNGSERARIDASGNLGLGVTPSAWDTSIFRTIQIGTGVGSATLSGRVDGGKDLVLGSNLYYATSSFRYVGTGTATMYRMDGATHAWSYAASGTAGNAISFTQAMTLRADGKLCVNATDGNGVLTVRGAGTTTGYSLEAANSTGATRFIVRDDGQSTFYKSDNAVSMTLDASGNLGVGTGSSTVEAQLHMQKATSGGEGPFIFLDNSAASALGNKTGIRFATDTGASFSGYSGSIESINTNAGNGAAALTFATFDGSARAERARITSDGIFQFADTNALKIRFNGSAANFYGISKLAGGGSLGDGEYKFTAGDTAAGTFTFSSGGTERARITSGGEFYVGCTAVPSATVSGVSLANPISVGSSKFSSGTTNSATLIAFINDNGQVGRIDVGSSATSYITSSDVSLKKNIEDADDAGHVIDSIAVRKFDWKVDGSHQRYGVVAQELILVAPEAVSVPRESGDLMGVDYSKLVPILVKAVQELNAKNASLEARLAALES